MQRAQTFLKSVAAGIIISMACIVYLIFERDAFGAFLFSVGLLTILSFDLNIFTGKVGYLTENKPTYVFTLILIWLGNLLGTSFTAFAILQTRLYAQLITSIGFVQFKIQDSPVSLFILAMCCGMLMYTAVESYKNHAVDNPVLAITLVTLCITVFVVCGFEHSIADMFLFIVYGDFTHSIIPLIVITIGNGCGSVLMHLLKF